MNDLHSDEADGKDETLCLWDGQMTDDVVWSWLCKVPAGVRIWMITDTCNSGTNYRGVQQLTPGIRARSRTANLSPLTSSLSPAPSLLHWGGCADGRSSFGSPQGGTFTTALVDAYVAGQSYAEWFASAKAKMPPGQTPTCESVGLEFADHPSFR